MIPPARQTDGGPLAVEWAMLREIAATRERIAAGLGSDRGRRRSMGPRALRLTARDGEPVECGEPVGQPERLATVIEFRPR